MTTEPNAMVQNAADPKQVERAKKKERHGNDQSLNAWREMAQSPHGQLVLDEILEQCRTFESVFQEGSLIYYLAGKQDLGHYVLARMNAADPMSIITLMQNRAKKEQNRNV